MSEVKVNKISPRTACGTTTFGKNKDKMCGCLQLAANQTARHYIPGVVFFFSPNGFHWFEISKFLETSSTSVKKNYHAETAGSHCLFCCLLGSAGWLSVWLPACLPAWRWLAGPPACLPAWL